MMLFEKTQRRALVSFGHGAVADYIGEHECCEPALILGHQPKVTAAVRTRNCRFGNGTLLRGSWSRRMRRSERGLLHELEAPNINPHTQSGSIRIRIRTKRSTCRFMVLMHGFHYQGSFL
jgi:hypothetical protein